MEVGEQSDEDCLDVDADGPFDARQLRLAFIANDNAKDRKKAFASIDNVNPGDRIVIENLVSGEQVSRVITPQGWFRAGIAGDALDPFQGALCLVPSAILLEK